MASFITWPVFLVCRNQTAIKRPDNKNLKKGIYEKIKEKQSIIQLSARPDNLLSGRPDNYCYEAVGLINMLLGLKKDTDMKCVGRTKNGTRCKNEARLLVCGHHKWQPIAFLLSVVTIIGVFGGVYQDVVKPISEEISLIEPNTPENNPTEIQQIAIPVEIESTWDEYSELDRKAEFYIVRSESPGMQTVILSGAAKVEIPKDGMTVNEMISISPHKTTKTKVILPKIEKLQRYLDEGGYEIQLVLFNQYGRVFPHMEQKLFDKEIISRGFRYWFRLVLKNEP